MKVKTRRSKIKRTGLRSSKFKTRRRRIFIVKLVASFALVCACGYGFYSVSRLSALSISSIEVEGSEMVAKSEIESVANNALAGAYMWLFPKRNVFLVPRSDIEKTLEESHPEFTDVHVETDGLKTIKIEVAERQPGALWCDGGQNEILAKSSDCYFADSTGFIFAKAPTYSGNSFPTFGGHLETEQVIGANILSERELGNYIEFLKNLSILNMVPAFMYIGEHNEYEVVLFTGARIIFSGTSDTLTIFENLKSILDEQGNAEARNQFLSELDYIDLRYGNKVYYKLK